MSGEADRWQRVPSGARKRRSGVYGAVAQPENRNPAPEVCRIGSQGGERAQFVEKRNPAPEACRFASQREARLRLRRAVRCQTWRSAVRFVSCRWRRVRVGCRVCSKKVDSKPDGDDKQSKYSRGCCNEAGRRPKTGHKVHDDECRVQEQAGHGVVENFASDAGLTWKCCHCTHRDVCPPRLTPLKMGAVDDHRR